MGGVFSAIRLSFSSFTSFSFHSIRSTLSDTIQVLVVYLVPTESIPYACWKTIPSTGTTSMPRAEHYLYLIDSSPQAWKENHENSTTFRYCSLIWVGTIVSTLLLMAVRRNVKICTAISLAFSARGPTSSGD